MDAPAPLVERHKTLLLRATAAWTLVGVILYLALPLLAPAVLLLSIGAPLAWRLMKGSGLPDLRRPSPVIVALLLAGAYLSINATWSLSPSTARVSLIMLFLFIAAVHVTLEALEDGDADSQRAMAIGLYAAMAIGGALICIEALSGQWLRQQAMALAPALRPDLRHMVVEDGRVTYMQTYLLNRSIAVLTLTFWPTLLVIVVLAATSRRHRWLLAGLVPAVAAILGGHHATSKIAFVGAATAFGALLVSPGIARRAIAWGWVATVVLVVPLATLAFQNELHLSSWMPRTAKHRIVIWGHTSQLIAKAPILGAGIHTARALHDPNDYDAPRAPGSEFRLGTGLHSHNGYLQTWYEAGAVGAAFLLGIGLLVLRSLAAAPAATQPYLYATFVACALMGGSSFSLWQPWFMAALGLAAVFAGLGWALGGQRESRSVRAQSASQ
jgi:O-antigen ligase